MTGSWIFGYGSIIWRPDFPFLRREPGSVQGWCRKFWQASSDHRGTPDQPGRVVTLIPDPGQRCWGVAYELAPEAIDEIFTALDSREQAGYERVMTSVRLTHNQKEIPGVSIYVASEGNPCFLGPCSDEELIAQVLVSRGPSGSNLDYVLQLAGSLREMGVEDSCVHDLERVLIQRSSRRC